MSNFGKRYEGVSHDTVRAMVRSTYNLHHSWPIDVELLSIYPNGSGNTEYEFKATFILKNDWDDEGLVTKFITVSIRDEY